MIHTPWHVAICTNCFSFSRARTRVRSSPWLGRIDNFKDPVIENIYKKSRKSSINFSNLLEEPGRIDPSILDSIPREISTRNFDLSVDISGSVKAGWTFPFAAFQTTTCSIHKNNGAIRRMKIYSGESPEGAISYAFIQVQLMHSRQDGRAQWNASCRALPPDPAGNFIKRFIVRIVDTFGEGGKYVSIDIVQVARGVGWRGRNRTWR